jgi:hypothetical protein
MRVPDAGHRRRRGEGHDRRRHTRSRAAARRRDIDPALLEPGQRPLYAFVLNHLLAEKLRQPGQAWACQAVLDATAAPGPAVRP